MATILIKRNDVSGSIPTPGELQDGELALNTVDGGLFYLNSGSGAVALVRTSGSVAVSSSYALTASFAANAGGAPATASYAVTSSYAATTSPIISSSYALTSSYAATTAPIVSSSYALSASWAPGSTSTSASYALTASYAALAQNVLGSITSASYALTASFATSASWAPAAASSVTASQIQYVQFAPQTSSYLSIGAYLATTYVSVSSGSAIRVRASINRRLSNSTVSFGISADSGSTGYLFRIQSDGSAIIYYMNTTGNVLQTQGVVGASTGGHLLEAQVIINSISGSSNGNALHAYFQNGAGYHAWTDVGTEQHVQLLTSGGQILIGCEASSSLDIKNVQVEVL